MVRDRDNIIILKTALGIMTILLFLSSLGHAETSDENRIMVLSSKYFHTTSYNNFVSFANTPTNWANVYKIEVSNCSYAIRLINFSLSNLDEREQEINLSKTMSMLEVAPKVIYGDANDGALIMEYIKAISLKDLVVTNAHLFALAKKLQKIHSLEMDLCRVRGQKKIKELFSKAAVVANENERFSFYLSAIDTYNELTFLLDNRVKKTVCHQDLNKTNLLFTENDVFIIDWDHADIADPFFDLATVINTLNLKEEQENYFLENYFERRVSVEEYQHIYVMKGICFLRYAIAVFALCGSYNELPVKATLENKLFPPFVYPIDAVHNKELALYMLSLSFYKSALFYINSESFQSFILRTGELSFKAG